MVELPKVDVAVAGGGPVGCALALALFESGVSVTRIAGEVAVADRPIALSHGSRLILERLGAWNSIRSSPIETIHVSQQGFGRTVMRCAEIGLPALGYVAAYSELVEKLAVRTPAVAVTLEDWKTDGNEIVLRLSRGAEDVGMRARLLVLADGGKSRGIEQVKDYRQQAIVAEVMVERPRSGIAWERFTSEGPLALLPYGDRYALVWSMRPISAGKLLGLSDRDFLERLREAFGGRLGEFLTVSPRAVFPLSLRRGAVNPEPRVLAVGNAAQTLHPVAGQGFNLGLRDAATLAEMLAKAEPGADFSPMVGELLGKFAAWRAEDRSGVTRFTDSLVKLFGSHTPGVSLVRNFGLLLFDLSPAAKRALSRVSWGFAGRMPRLARGLPLE